MFKSMAIDPGPVAPKKFKMLADLAPPRSFCFFVLGDGALSILTLSHTECRIYVWESVWAPSPPKVRNVR